MSLSKYKSDITFQFFLFLIRKHVHRDSPNYIDPFNINNTTKVDFNRLFTLITTHKVELVVLPILKNMNLPEFNYDRLCSRAKQIVRKQLLMEQVLVNIMQKLNENSIENIVFKGVVLDKKLYGNQSKRVYRDIDLLIKDTGIAKTHKLLLNMGFKLGKNSRYSPDFIKKYPTVKQGIKDLTYIHTEFNIILELHWRISPINNLKIDLCDENFFEVFKYGDKSYRSLKNEYELTYLIQHGAGSGWHRLKWLIDIVDYIKLIDIEKQLFFKIMKESKRYNSLLLSDLNFILKETLMFEDSILELNAKIHKNYLLKNYRQKYIINKMHCCNPSIKELTFKELFYGFVISSNKLKYLKTYAIGFYYKGKAIKKNKY